MFPWCNSHHAPTYAVGAHSADGRKTKACFSVEGHAVGVAYYNEKDSFAAEWLRKLIAANMIASGDVDERSIEDVAPLELSRYTQCHFFAGIGVWSYAMRRAGCSDDRKAWSGSCPCQPFSTAGEGAGFADERHLWPAFFHLIEQCRPSIVFGEQVASPDGLAWLDLVQSDMEGTDYAFGALDQCVAGFGAPHIRQRLYWVAYADGGRRDGNGRIAVPQSWQAGDAPSHGQVSRMAYANGTGLAQQQCNGRIPRGTLVALPWESSERTDGTISGMADAASQHGRLPNDSRRTQDAETGWRGPTGGHWRAADWLRCKDEKWRPVEPSAFPLAHGVANRVGLLRGYGNAIVAPQAEEFVRAAMEYAP